MIKKLYAVLSFTFLLVCLMACRITDSKLRGADQPVEADVHEFKGIWPFKVNQRNGITECTGGIIGPHTVIMSAHCIDPSRVDGGVRVATQNMSVAAAGYYVIDPTIVSQGLRAGRWRHDAGRDIALVVFPKSLVEILRIEPKDFLKVSLREPLADDSVFLVGHDFSSNKGKYVVRSQRVDVDARIHDDLGASTFAVENPIGDIKGAERGWLLLDEKNYALVGVGSSLQTIDLSREMLTISEQSQVVDSEKRTGNGPSPNLKPYLLFSSARSAAATGFYVKSILGSSKETAKIDNFPNSGLEIDDVRFQEKVLCARENNACKIKITPNYRTIDNRNDIPAQLESVSVAGAEQGACAAYNVNFSNCISGSCTNAQVCEVINFSPAGFSLSNFGQTAIGFTACENVNARPDSVPNVPNPVENPCAYQALPEAGRTFCLADGKKLVVLDRKMIYAEAAGQKGGQAGVCARAGYRMLTVAQTAELAKIKQISTVLRGDEWWTVDAGDVKNSLFDFRKLYSDQGPKNGQVSGDVSSLNSAGVVCFCDGRVRLTGAKFE